MKSPFNQKMDFFKNFFATYSTHTFFHAIFLAERKDAASLKSGQPSNKPQYSVSLKIKLHATRNLHSSPRALKVMRMRRDGEKNPSKHYFDRSFFFAKLSINSQRVVAAVRVYLFVFFRLYFFAYDNGYPTFS